ncbi:uncharacterized protein BDV17DRAFT_287921 [Aspergillus undulatus]|uniref:uncharacterized protein n=1 Tax=Aspergillus undulatus TaxID=1810928 RepID=UPI003CCCB74C
MTMRIGQRQSDSWSGLRLSGLGYALMVLNDMDHYFLSPLAHVAVPRAYWLTKTEKGAEASTDQILASHVMLIEPNMGNFQRIMEDGKSSRAIDMEILNHLFGDSAMILPHGRYTLLIGEFRVADH